MKKAQLNWPEIFPDSKRLLLCHNLVELGRVDQFFQAEKRFLTFWLGVFQLRLRRKKKLSWALNSHKEENNYQGKPRWTHEQRMIGSKVKTKRLTAIYAAQPALLVFAFESTNLPLIPKSHSFINPWSSTRILDGFMSVKRKFDVFTTWGHQRETMAKVSIRRNPWLTSVNDSVFFF